MTAGAIRVDETVLVEGARRARATTAIEIRFFAVLTVVGALAADATLRDAVARAGSAVRISKTVLPKRTPRTAVVATTIEVGLVAIEAMIAALIRNADQRDAIARIRVTVLVL